MKLYWPEFNHVLAKLPDRPRVRALLSTYGEIRLLYAVFLIDGIRIIDDAVARQEAVANAISANWISDETQERLLEFQTGDSDNRFPIPWIDRYVLPKHREDIEHLAAWNNMADGVPASILAARFPVDPRKVRPYLGRDGKLIPDLQPENVIIWLHFLVEGSRDSRLARAFALHRPDLLLPNYERYKSDWQSLGFSGASSVGLSC